MIYKPDTKFSGEDSFKFRITDPNNGVSNSAKVLIKVKSTDKSPSNDVIDRPIPNILTKSDNKTSLAQPEKSNHHPSADAGPDHAVNEGADVDLAGSGKDKDGDKLSYAWKQMSGPAVEIKGIDKPTPTFKVPDVDRDSLLQFLLTVKDGMGAQDTDNVSILVKNQNMTKVTSLIESSEKNNQTERIELK